MTEVMRCTLCHKIEQPPELTEIPCAHEILKEIEAKEVDDTTSFSMDELEELFECLKQKKTPSLETLAKIFLYAARNETFDSDLAHELFSDYVRNFSFSQDSTPKKLSPELSQALLHYVVLDGRFDILCHLQPRKDYEFPYHSIISQKISEIARTALTITRNDFVTWSKTVDKVVHFVNIHNWLYNWQHGSENKPIPTTNNSLTPKAIGKLKNLFSNLSATALRGSKEAPPGLFYNLYQQTHTTRNLVSVLLKTPVGSL